MIPRILVGLTVAVVYGGPVALAQSPPTEPGITGTWEIVTLIDDGVLIPPASIGTRLAKQGQIKIDATTLTLTRPGQAEPRALPYVANPAAEPKTLDIAGTVNTGSKGIYLHDGDTLIVCLDGPNSTVRPTEFGSFAGTGSVFMTLRRVAKPAPGAAPPPPPQPVTPIARTVSDATYRENLVGTWGHQNQDVVSYTTLNEDGTYTSTMSWKQGFRRVFHEDVRNSGTWKIEDGSLVTRVTASTDPKQDNQLYVSKISSVDDREAVFIDMNGQSRQEWKVR